MAMIECPECKKEISESAESCPNCGRPNPKNNNSTNPTTTPKKVSILLGVGIFLVPYIFSWFTLKKGYSTLSRVLSFAWLAIALLVAVSSDSNNTTKTASVTKAPARQEKTYPSSNASYAEVNSAIGCESKYSDDKKKDIFNSNYKNHWFTWRGVVVLAESDEASLNIDRFGTQDLQVDFANPKAGYNLTKDSIITVKFLMKTAGGCFLPFSGEKAIIIE